MSSRTSLETRFCPGDFLTFENIRQYPEKLARCHRTTVSGATRISDCFHEDQKRCAITQNSLSTPVSLGRGCLHFEDD